jgi:hypothetical protein
MNDRKASCGPARAPVALLDFRDIAIESPERFIVRHVRKAATQLIVVVKTQTRGWKKVLEAFEVEVIQAGAAVKSHHGKRIRANMLDPNVVATIDSNGPGSPVRIGRSLSLRMPAQVTANESRS